jgi:hypothetical protein
VILAIANLNGGQLKRVMNSDCGKLVVGTALWAKLPN